MANALDETRDPVSEGRETGVIDKQIPVTVGVGSKVFEVMLWVLLIVPGLIFQLLKVRAQAFFNALEQRIQHAASQIDNYIEQRVLILQNAASLVEKSMEFDRETLTQIAKYRAGGGASDADRIEVSGRVDRMFNSLNVAVENYPELRAHEQIAAAMQQNAYLQKEITAAREIYNDRVMQWNKEIWIWPTKRIVAAKNGYTTRIPFSTSREFKERAQENFFD